MSSHHNSLRWRSGVNLVVIAAALVAITVITNAYSFNLMLRNFRQSLSSTAQIYTEQISGKVDKINSGSLELVSLAASSQNYYTSSPLGRYLTQQEYIPKNPMAAAPMIKKSNFMASQGKEDLPTFETVTIFTP